MIATTGSCTAVVNVGGWYHAYIAAGRAHCSILCHCKGNFVFQLNVTEELISNVVSPSQQAFWGLNIQAIQLAAWKSWFQKCPRYPEVAITTHPFLRILARIGESWDCLVYCFASGKSFYLVSMWLWQTPTRRIPAIMGRIAMSSRWIKVPAWNCM